MPNLLNERVLAFDRHFYDVERHTDDAFRAWRDDGVGVSVFRRSKPTEDEAPFGAIYINIDGHIEYYGCKGNGNTQAEALADLFAKTR